jgi:murein DD-endopeptidase MepM/ murein hydrolase activator NlpD
MNEDIKDIIQSFDLMLGNNKSVVNEVALISPLNQTSVNSGFGARWGKTHNGVDLAANATEVKSPADGVVEVGAIKNDDCGGTIIINHAGGFKTGFCHMQKINVKPGDNVKQGDVIGISGGGKGDVGHGRSDGRHLHFTLRKDGKLVNPIDYIDKSGVIMTGSVPQSTTSGDTTNNSNTTTASKTKKNSDDVFGVRNLDPDDIMVKKAREMATQFGLSEQKIYGTFGDRLSDRFGSIIIPARNNSKIKSPVDGIIYVGHADSNCKNQVSIEHNIEGKRYFLQFCNITEPNIKNGGAISKGASLGKTSDDVKVSLFDSGWNRKDLLSMMNKEIKPTVKSTVKSKKEKNKKDGDYKKKKEPMKYYDPTIPFIFKKIHDMIPSMTKNKKDEEPKISNFFSKYGLTGKKIDENIERIKKLL